MGEINDIEHNKGSTIYPQNQVILDCTVELRWLELVGTVCASSTHPCVRAIPGLTIFQVGLCVLYVITDITFVIEQSCKAHVTPVTDQKPYAR